MVNTVKLYLYDSYLKEVDARVVEMQLLKRRRAYIVFNKTIFHPLTGGQASDRGEVFSKFARFRVKKVIVRGGVILHYGVFDNKVFFEEGDEVTLRIDWEHRYKVMRLHTAGHILDYALMKVYNRLVETLSAYHGLPKSYLEYRLSEEPRVGEILEIANEVVEQAHPVRIKFVDKNSLSKFIYNAPNIDRIPILEEYRIVEISGVNAMPCTGTHVANTREVGEIVIDNTEKTGKGWKIYYDVKP